MITDEQNALLTRTGPGTAMGALLRRYWIPFLLAEELPAADCAPVRVTLLSERLIAFRDTAGRIGLIDQFCAHRGASLWFGRNEENGLRCAYHGWKYDVSGQCIEVPSDPAGTFCKRMRLKAYPCREGGGVVWAYMGPLDAMPALPDFEWMAVPDPHRYVSKRLQDSNYLQAMEGGIDGAHVSWLHRGALDHEPMRRGSRGAEYQRDTRPRMEVAESPAGITIGARRAAEGGSCYWRLTQWVMPWYNMIPPYGDHALHGHAWVPIDDTSCFAWTFTHHPTRPLSAEEHAAMQSGEGIYATLVPGTYRPVASKANDYLMDRAAQKAGRYYSGVPGIAMQDASLQESPGPIADRAREHLTTTDTGIAMARNRLLRTLRAMEQGESPPALDPATHRVRAASFVRSADLSFKELVDEVSGASASPGTAHLTI